jgi:alkanesulfonate monooxygenase SsuD/methylene tetrahydromethanopterin reductase-like flavin-dependent oxidoreductase (luciferase family)
MKFGVFCFYENYAGDFNQALSQQTALVKFVDQLEFDEAWLAEHHFNHSAFALPFNAGAHLASVTETIRIGTAAVLLPFHDPVKIAEDLATLIF